MTHWHFNIFLNSYGKIHAKITVTNNTEGADFCTYLLSLSHSRWHIKCAIFINLFPIQSCWLAPPILGVWFQLLQS